MSDIVNKLWGFCHTLKHDGIGYAFYVEQLTYMLFIKMAEERGVELPKKCDWKTLSNLSGTDLVDGYTDILRALGKTPGILGDIFAGAQNRFNKAVNLKKLISLIGEVEWSSLGEDVKAHAYEGLLEKAASEGKKGAGQYFTPRVLIQTIVRCMKPDPRAKADFTLCDPACGTGGFLVAVHEWLATETKGAMERQVAKRVRSNTYFGGDIDQEPRRLALMNLYLHGIEPHIRLGDAIYEPAPSERFDVILTNPPFGTRGANQAPERDDFTVSTSNKQLNFVQHVLTLLKPGGRAAVVLPDNCLFEDQAGEVFKILMEDCDLHTVLRLPRGTFTPYSQGVKANVIFFSKGAPSSTTWIYDARTNVPQITKKDRPLTPEHFKEFEKCFGADPNGRAKRKASDSKEDRWKSFSIAEVKERAYKLDGFKWLKDDSIDDGDDLPEPEELVTDAIGQLEGAASELGAVLQLLESSDRGDPGADGLPEGWATLTLAEAVDPNALIQYGILQPGPDVAGGVPYVRPTEIVNDEIDIGSIKRTSKEIAAKYARSSLSPDDVILSIVGSIGKVAVVPRRLDGANITQSSARLRPRAGVVESKYLAWFLRSPSARAQFQEAELGTGVPRLNIGDIRQMTIPLAPLPEQKRITAQIEALVARVNTARQQLARVPLVLRTEHDDKLTQTILGKAFTGRLVVPEAELAAAAGRAFESAEDLLKRVRARDEESSRERGVSTAVRNRVGRPTKSLANTAPR